MFGLGLWELILIIAILLLLFGGVFIPRLLRGVGEGARDLKTMMRKPAEGSGEGGDKPGQLPPPQDDN